MAVCKMQRMNICGMQENRKAILERLQAAGAMEINIPDTGDALSTMDTTASRQRFERQAQQLRQALEVLDRYAPEKKSMFAGLAGKDLIPQADYDAVCARRQDIIAAAQDVLNKEKAIGEQRGAIARLENQMEALTPWLNLDVPMSFRGTKATRLLLGAVPGSWTGETLTAAVRAALPPEQEAVETELLSLGRDYGYLAVLCMKEDEAAVETALRSIGFARPTQSGTGTPAEQQEALLRQKQEAEQAIADLSAALSKLGARRRDFEILSDYYGVRADKYAVLGRLPQSRHTFLVSGYVPEYRAAALARDLETRCGAAVEIEELPEDEDPPVLLKNNHFGAMTEGILKSFGLPAKGEMDPAFFTTVFYIFFFGLMLSDAAYGLIMALGCGWALLKFPRMGDSMKKSLQLFFWCGLSTVFWGVMFGGFFGDAVDVISRTFFGKDITLKPLWFAPLTDPTKLLVYSMLFGLIHLLTGLALKGYMCVKHKDFLGLIFDVGCWFLLIIGLTLMLLPTDLFYGISQMKFDFSPALRQASKIMALAGAAGILLMSARDKKNPFLRLALGAYDLYGVSGWLSDVLSYSRLLALGLATGVIGQVINQMASMPGNTVFGVIAFVLIFLVGHTLNIGINLLGAYVHTCRLQYVEFYGKFYEGGGREFQPFHQQTTYVDIKEEN